MNIDVYKSIVANSTMALGYHKILCNKQGIPQDYEFIEINPEYEKLTGFKAVDIIGKKISQLIPDIKTSKFDWIDTYGDIAINGGSKEFKTFSDSVHEYINLKVFSPKKNYFITIFNDIAKPKSKKESFPENNLYIDDFLDIPEIQSVVDEFNKITKVAMAIGNIDGKLLVKSGFQDICQNFHRKNSMSCANCTKSDISLFQSAISGKYQQYKCLNNMWDISTPIIVSGKIIGAIYLGQFIYDDDKIDDEVFKKQAKLYGYDEEAYLKALDKVPRVSHQKIENIMNFYVKFANMVALLGYKNISIQLAHTQQEELIKSLKESEKRFAATINNIPDAILVFDSNYTIQYANNAIYALSSKHPPHLVGAKAEEIWQKNNVQAFLPAIKKTLDTKKVQLVDLEMANNDNISRNYHITFVPITEKSMDIQILGIFHDYTIQKKNNEAKLYQDVLINEMGEIAKIGGWEFNPVSGEGTWTDEVSKIHELDPKDKTNMAKGMSFYTGDSKNKIESSIKQAIAQAKPYDIELELITAKGNKKWIRTIGQPTLKDDKVVRIHGSFQDITDKIKAKEAIEKLNSELEQRVESRTKQLAEANKELDTFTYSVSHDLKAPLRGIDGYSKLLLEEFEDQLNEEGKYFLTTIRQSVTRMNQLIEDLLAFSRLDRKQWQSIEVDLNKLVKELITELANEFLAGGGIINIYIPNIILKTQYEGVSMAIKNMIENAIKYSPNIENSIIEIRAEEKQDHILIQVKDNGLGFDMKYHDKIFNIFERLHRAEEYPGTGIGLAIVKRVAERLNGDVWATSKLGNGSSFYFKIPKEI